jgi:hypothetical protein
MRPHNWHGFAAPIMGTACTTLGEERKLFEVPMTTPEFITEVNEAIDLYEKLIGSVASRTRQMIDNHGTVEALSRLVVSPDLQSGFKVLRDQDNLDSTFEAIVVRHPELFQVESVEAAQWRLDNPHDLL